MLIIKHTASTYSIKDKTETILKQRSEKEKEKSRSREKRGRVTQATPPSNRVQDINTHKCRLRTHTAKLQSTDHYTVTDN